MGNENNLSFEEMMEEAFADDVQSEETVENPSETETDPAEASADGASGTEGTEPSGSTADRNGRQAYGRKIREANARYDRLNQEVDDFFKSQGYESFADAKDKQAKALLDKEIGNLGFNANDIAPAVEAVVNNMPAMQAARELAQKAENDRNEMLFNQEFEKIQKLDPSIKTVDDLLEMENRELFDDYVINRQIPLSEAYKLVHFDKLLGSKADAASQRAINSVASKNHLSRTSSSAGNSIEVPADIYSTYKALNPNASDEEIRKHYAKSLK